MNETTRTTARKVLSGGVSLLASQGISMVLFFLAQRLILSELTKEQNGVLMSERRIVDLLMLAFVDFGMNSVVMRRAIDQPDRARAVLSSAAGLRLLLWLASFMLVVGYSLLADVHMIHVVIWATYLLITARTGLLRYNYELSARSQLAFGAPTIASVLDAICFAALMWWQQSELTPTVIMGSYLAASIPGFVMMVVVDRGRSIRWSWMEAAEMKTILREALPVFVAFGLLNLHDKIDVVLLTWLSTEVQVGIYGAAYVTLSPLTGTIPLAASMVMVPVIARYAASDMARCETFAVAGLRLLTASAAILSSVLTALAPLIIWLISKNRYADNVAEYVLFLWMPLPIFLLVYIQEVQVALGRQGRNLPIAILLAGGSLLAGAVLIPLFEAQHLAAFGAISARMIVTIAGAGVAVWVLRRVFPQRLQARTISALLIVGVGSAAIAVGSAMYLSSVWASVVAGGCSVALVFGTRLLTWADVQTVYAVVRSRTASQPA